MIITGSGFVFKNMKHVKLRKKGMFNNANIWCILEFICIEVYGMFNPPDLGDITSLLHNCSGGFA